MLLFIGFSTWPRLATAQMDFSSGALARHQTPENNDRRAILESIGQHLASPMTSLNESVEHWALSFGRAPTRAARLALMRKTFDCPGCFSDSLGLS